MSANRHVVWRVLRQLLPRGYRERNADEVLRTHIELAGGEVGARGASFWFQVGRDVLVTGLQLRLDGWFRPGGQRLARKRGMSVGEAARRSLYMGARSVRRSPFFTVAVVLILAAGISANVTIFRVLDRLLLSPPERIEDPDGVRRVYVLGHSPFSGQVEHTAALSYPSYRGLREVGGFEAVAGYGGRTLTLSEGSAGESVSVEFATSSYFELLGVVPAVGRFYDAAEDSTGAETNVAVLGWTYWRSRFAGDRSVLGRELSIGKTSYTVIGVAPRGFTGVGIKPVDVWLPLHVATTAENGSLQWLDAHGWLTLAAVVRVSGPEVPAEDEATSVMRRVREAGGRADPELRVVLAPLISALGPGASRESRVARILAVLTALVLVITCANAGNLYLARVLARRRELAVRSALGESRGRLFGQLITEVTIVSLSAGLVALWLGTAAAAALFRVLLPDAALPTSDGPRVLAVTVGLALATTLLTGLLPALRATRVSVMDALRSGTATRRTLLARRGLLALQAALSVVLLVGAGLFIRSLRHAESIDFGLDTSTMTVDIELEGGVTFGGELGEETLRLLPLLRSSPLVESAAATSLLPYSGWWGIGVSSPDGEPVESGASGPFVYGVTGDYFATLSLRIVAGRPITDDDLRPGANPVALVNERLASLLWPGREAPGQCLMVDRGPEQPSCTTVVGVASDYVPSIGAEEAPAIFYVPPNHAALGSVAANAILVRPREGTTPAMLRSAIRGIAPHLRMVTVSTLGERLEPSLRAWRLGATLLTAVGVLALLIAAAGLYSMLTFDVMQRRRELGIRAALGASASRLVRATVATSVTAVGIGVAIGLTISLAGGRAVEAQLFQVSAKDPVVYAGVCLALLATGLLAGLLPARTVTRTDPAVPLREQ